MELSYDPYDVGITVDPYPTFRRLREEAPLYYNETYDFWAVSRWDDVERGLFDRETFPSGRGAILEMIKAHIKFPPGTLIFEDPPIHDVHRGLLTRVFTPRKMNALEPKIREFCARCLDPLLGAREIDFVADLGAQMPMRVIGMLLGIPDDDLMTVREQADANLRTEAGKPMPAGNFIDEGFDAYVEWRTKHPSDDLMTELLNAEFEDEGGARRRLTREELLTLVTVIAGAGNETTNRLIGWIGKVLGEHPEQRREIAANRTLVPKAVEEVLRFEPPAPHVARYVAKDVAFHGRTVPAGSVMMFLIGAANRDERRYSDGDRFDIHRESRPSMVFGNGIHFCLGAALARLEGRIALDEVLNRFRDWEVDWSRAKLAPTSTVRGWETLPVFVRA